MITTREALEALGSPLSDRQWAVIDRWQREAWAGEREHGARVALAADGWQDAQDAFDRAVDMRFAQDGD